MTTDISPAPAPAGVRDRDRNRDSLRGYVVAVHRRQRRYLRDLAWRAFPVRRPVQHDFGGATRGIRLLHGMVRTAHVYDGSAVPQPARADLPAVVTAFLPPGHDAVRERALAFARRALPHYSAGLLLIEDHGEHTPLEMADLLDPYGFAIVEWRGFGLLAPAWYRPRWLRPLARLIDDVACRVPALRRYARTVLYVARRVHAGAPPAESR